MGYLVTIFVSCADLTRPEINFYFEELQYALDFIGAAIDHSSNDSLYAQIHVVDKESHDDD